MPYLGDTGHSGFARLVPSQHFHSPVVALCACAFPGGMDAPIHRSRVRTQRARVFSRLAFPVCRRALVVGEDSRQGVRISSWFQSAHATMHSGLTILLHLFSRYACKLVLQLPAEV